MKLAFTMLVGVLVATSLGRPSEDDEEPLLNGDNKSASQDQKSGSGSESGAILVPSGLSTICSSDDVDSLENERSATKQNSQDLASNNDQRLQAKKSDAYQRLEKMKWDNILLQWHV